MKIPAIGNKSVYNIIFLLIVVLCSCKHRRIEKFVFDTDKALSDSQAIVLNNLYKAHERRTTNEIALITISSYGPEESLRSYAVNRFNKAGIGKKKAGNGMLIVLCARCHKIEIVLGTGINKVLSNELTHQIIEKYMTPEFAAGGFYRGIYNGSTRLIDYLERPENRVRPARKQGF